MKSGSLLTHTGREMRLPSGLLDRVRAGGQSVDAGLQRRLRRLFGLAVPELRFVVCPELESIGVRALASGRHLAFAPGEYNPDSANGRTVLLHEIAHVLQWCARQTPPGWELVWNTDLERAAAAAAGWLEAALAGGCPAGSPAWFARVGRAPALSSPAALPLLFAELDQFGRWILGTIPDQEIPPGWTRIWDPNCNDYVDVRNAFVGSYKYSMQQAIQAREYQQAMMQQAQQHAMWQQAMRQQALFQQQQSKALTITAPQTAPPLKPPPTAVVSVPTTPPKTVKILATGKPHPAPVATVFSTREILQKIFSGFDQRELMRLRIVSKVFDNVAEDIIWRKFVKFTGLSSVIAAQGAPHVSFKKAIQNHLLTVHQTGGMALMASDQITNKDLLLELMGPCIEIRINIGSTDGPGLSSSRGWDAVMVEKPVGSAHGKPHTKFISGGGSVFLGSPNFTPPALTPKKNIESGVQVSSLQVQGLFNRYWQLMRGSSLADRQQFQRLVTVFNNRNQKMRLALAPFIEVQPFLLAELHGASEIIVRMFLISHLDTNNDIVSGLNALAKAGAKITVVVDESQFAKASYFDREQDRTRHYVQEALEKLVRDTGNVTVHVQKRVLKGKDYIMHDKLILAKFTGKRNFNRVLLGSSGFSTHVMHNENYDLMVSIDDDALYDYFFGHHKETMRTAKTSVVKYT